MLSVEELFLYGINKKLKEFQSGPFSDEKAVTDFMFTNCCMPNRVNEWAENGYSSTMILKTDLNPKEKSKEFGPEHILSIKVYGESIVTDFQPPTQPEPAHPLSR